MPVGEYVAQVVEASIQQPNSGDGYYLALTWKIIEGDFEGRQVWQRITFLHSSEQAQTIGRKTLKGSVRRHSTSTNRSTTPRSSCSSRRAFGSGSRRTSRAFIPTKTGSRASCRWKRSRRNRNSRPSRQPGDQSCRGSGRHPSGPRLVPLPGTRNVDEEELGRRLSGKAPATYQVMFELRPYQREALAALEDYWSRGGGNPLVTMATATGKSVVIAHLIRDISRRYPALRVLVVTHVLELIDRISSPCSRCGRTRPSESTARASASANGTRRSSSPGCRASGATPRGSDRGTWC